MTSSYPLIVFSDNDKENFKLHFPPIILWHQDSLISLFGPLVEMVSIFFSFSSKNHDYLSLIFRSSTMLFWAKTGSELFSNLNFNFQLVWSYFNVMVSRPSFIKWHWAWCSRRLEDLNCSRRRFTTLSSRLLPTHIFLPLEDVSSCSYISGILRCCFLLYIYF